MGYPTVGKTGLLPGSPCEVCATSTTAVRLRGGGELTGCPRCGHLRRDLGAAPAAHRDHAYGGEPTLDSWRLALTHRALVRDGEPARVFEIGFGAGGLLRRFLDRGARVGGIDPDQLHVDVDPLVLEQGDLRAGAVEDLEPGSVDADLVVGIHVLEHVQDPARAMAAVRAAVGPGGRIAFLTPAGDGLGRRLWGAAWWMLEDPTHLRFFSAESLARLATDAGFVDVRVERLLLDSLVTDAASARRVLARRPLREGALAARGTLALAGLCAPVVLAARVVLPQSRTTLALTARVPGPVDGGEGPPGEAHGIRVRQQARGPGRSVHLFSSFRVEQSDPDRFYGDLAADSIATLHEHLDLRGALVLDAGAGPKQFAEAFRAAGARYVPLDHDPLVSSVRDGGLVADATALPIADRAVDLVFSSNLLEHVPTPEAVADELVRVVRPGGLLFLSYTNWLSPWGGHETSPWHWLGGRYAARRFHRRTGRRPKNRIDENMFRVSVAQMLRWAEDSPEVEVLVARPRYLPDVARHLLRVPGARELLTWNLLLVLRRR